MSESEKLQQTIAELSTEQATLAAELQALAERVKAAEVAADAAAAHAGRHPSPEADAASTAAEEQRQALESQIRRKRAAQAACERDLATARHGLAEAKRGALFVQLQSLLDSLEVASAAIDENPTYLDNWVALHGLTTQIQLVYVTAGGKGRLIESAVWARGQLFGALAVQIDWTLGGRAEAPKPIPAIADLLQLPHAAGRVRELMGVA